MDTERSPFKSDHVMIDELFALSPNSPKLGYFFDPLSRVDILSECRVARFRRNIRERRKRASEGNGHVESVIPPENWPTCYSSDDLAKLVKYKAEAAV